MHAHHRACPAQRDTGTCRGPVRGAQDRREARGRRPGGSRQRGQQGDPAPPAGHARPGDTPTCGDGRRGGTVQETGGPRGARGRTPDGPEQPIPRASKHPGLSCGLLHPRAPAAARRAPRTRGCLGPQGAGRGPLLGPRPSGGPPPTQCPLTASSHIGEREAVYSHGYRDPREKSFRAISPERAPRAPGCTVSLQFDRFAVKGPSRAA